MKKITYLMMLAVAVLLASCSQDENLENAEDRAVAVTFRLATDEVNTRAAVDETATPTRYVVEAYQEDGSGAPIAEDEKTTGELSINLRQGIYTCLFWADYGEDNYDIADLRAVSRKADASNPLAYCLKATVTVSDGAVQTFKLHHAVAAIRMVETKGIPESRLTVSFTNHYTGYNVLTGGVQGTATTYSETVTAASCTGENTIASFYTFAPSDEASISVVTFKLDDNEEKTVPNVPLQTNYETQIKGSFSSAEAHSFAVTATDAWEVENKQDLDGNVYPLKLGDKFKKVGVEVGPVIWVGTDKALVMVGYDLQTKREVASAEAYAEEKGGRLPTQSEYSAIYSILRDDANAGLFGGSVVSDFKGFTYITYGQGEGVWYWQNSGSWVENDDGYYKDARVLAVMEVNW